MRRLAAAALALGLASGTPAAAEPLAIDFHRIERFSIAGAEPEGALTFVGGLQLSADHAEFGGFSGVAVARDGEGVLLLNDSGSVVRARLVHENGILAGIADADIDNLLPGELSKQSGDTEDIAFDPVDPTRGAVVRERQANAMLSFRVEDGRLTDFRPVTVGADNRLLRSNLGLESVAYAVPASPAAGEIIAIAERPPRGQTSIPGWIAGKGSFEVVRRDDFDVSSARFLPDGDLLLLERRFAPAWGIGMRLRRIPAGLVAAGQTLDGEILLDAGMTSQIDNMEGLDIHRDAAGRTILTIVSDDNHNAFQRTLILQFALSNGSD